MAIEPIRVGIIGANPDRGWGSGVHAPVLQHLRGFDLVAVGTSRIETAERSARRFGARHAFTSVEAMAAHPDVDLIAICVLAPYHHEIAMTVLDAGKHVYCEWPLSTDTTRAIAMRDLAASRGLGNAIGLQLRGNPEIQHMHDLIADGYVGEVRSATLHCAIPGIRDMVPESAAGMTTRAAGTTTLSIHGGHALDALRFLAGDFASLSSQVLTQYPHVTLIETGEVRVKDAPDQVLVQGITRSGAAVTAHISSVAGAGCGMEIRIQGTDGCLVLTSPSANPPPMMRFSLHGAQAGVAVAPIPIPERYDCTAIPRDLVGTEPYPGVQAPRSTLVSIANLYQRLGQRIRGSATMAPDFATAVEMHQLLDAIERSSATGERQIMPV